MKKYFAGIIVLGLITLGLAGYILSLGLASRQDVKTSKDVQTVATKLNSFVSSKNKIPNDLKEAGADNVSDAIKYKKLSNTEYQVCVTYKAAKGYGGGDISGVVTGALISNVAGANYSSTDSDFSDTTSYKQSTYYAPYTYKKGENCQTVKPYLKATTTSTGLNDDDYCSPTGKYYTYYKDYCVDGEIQFN